MTADVLAARVRAVPSLHGPLARLRRLARRAASRVTSRRRIAGRDNVVCTAGAVLRGCTIEIRGDRNRIEIAPEARLLGTVVRMIGDGHVLRIGAHVTVRGGGFFFEHDDGAVVLGARTTAYGARFGVTEGGSIQTGEDCLLAEEVEIRTGDSHAILDAATGERLNGADDVTIGAHVWLGLRAVVLKGAAIGAGTVVGAGSVVCGALPETAVCAGVPARPLRTGIRWQRQIG